MSYELIYSDMALKQLKKLDKTIQTRILLTLERCRVRPHDHIKKVVGIAYYRVRISDYRVIIDICQNQLMILVIELGHKSQIYDES